MFSLLKKIAEFRPEPQQIAGGVRVAMEQPKQPMIELSGDEFVFTSCSGGTALPGKL